LNQLKINEGQNFSCECFGRIYVPDDIASGVEIAPNFYAGRGLPVIHGEHWERWLGEITFESIKQGLVLTLLAPQPAPGHVVNLELSRKLNRLDIAIILQGVPNYEQGFLIAGANQTGEAEVRQFSRAARIYHRTRGMHPLTIGRVELDRAAFLAAKLERIDYKGSDWRRLRRSIDCLAKGSAEPHLNDEKIHQFARSLEGLILPDTGATKRQFVHRLKTFVVANSATDEILGQIFDIRSNLEHLHNALDALPSGTQEERENLLYKRARQIDRLARFAISHVLENDTLCSIFKTDADIAAFWAKKDHECRALWGKRLDIERDENESED
jgi:hypothetical protein